MLLLCALQQLLLSNAVIPNACSKFLHAHCVGLAIFQCTHSFFDGWCLFCRWHAGERIYSCRWVADDARVQAFCGVSSLADDTPAQQKWLQCMAHNGRLPCRACTIHGVQFETQKGGGTVYNSLLDSSLHLTTWQCRRHAILLHQARR